MKLLTLIRGKSGSGKSYLAEALYFYHEKDSARYFAADDYFTDEEGVYTFDATSLPVAHANCRTNTTYAMEDGVNHIIVHNTFTRKWEMQPYLDLAKEYGYAVQTIIVDADCFNNVHNVPAETVAKQKARFEY